MLTLNEALKYAGLPIKEEDDSYAADRKIARGIINPAKEAWGYKDIDTDYEAKTVKWITQGPAGQDQADAIASRFKKAGLTGWTIKFQSRDERDSDKWFTAKS